MSRGLGLSGPVVGESSVKQHKAETASGIASDCRMVRVDALLGWRGSGADREQVLGCIGSSGGCPMTGRQSEARRDAMEQTPEGVRTASYVEEIVTQPGRPSEVRPDARIGDAEVRQYQDKTEAAIDTLIDRGQCSEGHVWEGGFPTIGCEECRAVASAVNAWTMWNEFLSGAFR